jgi:hypothetical protein
MVTDDLLVLLKSAILKTEATGLSNQLEWVSIYKSACLNNIAMVIYSSICKLPVHIQPDAKLVDEWRNCAIQAGIHQMKQNIETQKLLNGLAELFIKPIIFKGAALAILYPEPLMRVSGDVDMLVKEEDRSTLIDYLINNSFDLVEEQWNGDVLEYCSKRGLKVEFHFSLWEGYHGKRINLLESMHIIDHTIRVKWMEGELETLDYEAHLIYQIYHLVKHFSLEGIGLRYLADLTLYVNAYLDKLNFISFWEKLQVLGYEDFCTALFTICVNKLGMNEKALYNSTKASDDIVRDLLEDISKVGFLNNSDNESWNTLNIMKPYLMGEKDLSGDKWRIELAVLFPSRYLIQKDYQYLNKSSLLLPIAWVHRAIRHCFFTEHANTVPKLYKAQNRLKLMKRMKLIKKI